MDKQRQPHWRPTRRHDRLRGIGIVASLLVVGSILGGYVSGTVLWNWTGIGSDFWNWTGIVKDADFPKRTLWDWLKLLIIPAAIAAGTLWFNWQQRKRDEQRAREQSRDDALQAYLGTMSELMITHGLRTRTSQSEQDVEDVRAVAKAQTLTVLPRLGGIHKASVLQFLAESGLISNGSRVLSLSMADLSEVDLSNAHLRWADLKKWGEIPVVDESMIVDLTGIDLSEAYLPRAKLPGVRLSNSNLSNARLPEADLSEADLSMVDLSGASLRGARLLNANLMGTKLHGTDLAGANLLGAGWLTSKKVSAPEGPLGLIGACMPDGEVPKDYTALREWVERRRQRELQDLEHFLRGIDFAAKQEEGVSKEEVASIAKSNKAPQEVVKLIRDARPQRFKSVVKVLDTILQAVEEGRWAQS